MKYRILEKNGLFYPQKKVLFWWSNMSYFYSFYLTLEDAQNYIDRTNTPDVIKIHPVE